MILSAIRRLLGLPKAHCTSSSETEWVPMRDGVRLCTRHIWPVDVDGPAPTLLIRTPYGSVRRTNFAALAGRLLAESGYHVIVQDVRGRFDSEGDFTPFVSEREDGGDALRWIADQFWCDGPVGLFGASYAGYCAWAALEDAPAQVAAITTTIGSGDVYHSFYTGGAFALSVAFEWGISVGRQQNVRRRQIDMERGLAHQPLREADRVALRVVDWYRDWIDHPRRDGYWAAIDTNLPDSVPPALLVAGWYDLFLDSQLRDYAKLVAHARRSGGVAPELVIGPWSHGFPAQRRWWRQGFLGTTLRATLRHFETHLRADGDSPSASSRVAREPVRYFVTGLDRWRYQESWPPPGLELRKLYLHGASESARYDANGSLRFTPAGEPCASGAEDDERASSHYDHDPADPRPTLGGALFGSRGGAKDLRKALPRNDLASFESAPLDADLEIEGRVDLELYASTDVDDVDFTARLVDISSDGRAINVCDGIARGRWSRGESGDAQDDTGDDQPWFPGPGTMRRIVIELGCVATTFLMGHRIRLEIASANFPRFDRNPGTSDVPAMAAAAAFAKSHQVIQHDADHPSALRVWVR